jgi:tryptophan-rich sensory protein
MNRILRFAVVWTAIYAVFAVPGTILLSTDPRDAPFFIAAILVSFVLTYVVMYRRNSEESTPHNA